jgi:hypothetical protein
MAWVKDPKTGQSKWSSNKTYHSRVGPEVTTSVRGGYGQVATANKNTLSKKDQSRVGPTSQVRNASTAAAGGLGFQAYGNPFKSTTAQTQKDTSTKTRNKFYGGAAARAAAPAAKKSAPKSSAGGQKIYGGSFSQAFGAARAEGAKTFGWSGKPGMSFSTKLAGSSGAKKTMGGSSSGGGTVKKTSGGTASKSKSTASKATTSSGRNPRTVGGPGGQTPAQRLSARY